MLSYKNIFKEYVLLIFFLYERVLECKLSDDNLLIIVKHELRIELYMKTKNSI